jgi:hypothetical protein
MDERTFVQTLAERFQSVVPEGFIITAFDDEVEIGFAGYLWTGTAVGTLFRESGPEIAASAMLNGFQDYIIEEWKGENWPPTPNRLDRLPLPNAVVEDGVLHMWYGDRANPALVVPSITLSPSS